jgi:hypothetical protein
MVYNLGCYRYKNGKIYEQVWWFIYKCIDRGPYTYLDGVRQVNTKSFLKAAYPLVK